MRLVFAGTPEFAAQSLAALHDAGHQIPLVLTQPDRPACRGMRTQASAVKQLALARNLDLSQPETLRDAAALERVRAARPEVLIVAAYGLILPRAALAIAPLGALNIHASLLPRWRGAAPIQRALLAGDRETGISIMQMDEGLDTGPVLARQALAIDPGDDAQSLHDRLAALGARMVVAALAEVAAGRARAEPQPSEGATYARKIDKTEAEIDWGESGASIERRVRALRPTPGAQTSHGGAALKIWRADVAEGRGAAGSVLASDANGIVVACGEGALRITELQRAGSKRLAAGEFLRGHALHPGDRLGAAG